MTCHLGMLSKQLIEEGQLDRNIFFTFNKTLPCHKRQPPLPPDRCMSASLAVRVFAVVAEPRIVRELMVQAMVALA